MQKRLSADDLCDAATAENTIIAYSSDVERFLSWGGSIPCQPAVLCRYLAEHAESNKATTLERWVAAISVAHKNANFDNPTRHPSVRNTLRGIRREYRQKVHRVQPITSELLMSIVDKLPPTLAAKRDRALLLLGFAAAMRRSEVSALEVGQITFLSSGMILDFGKSKTDQEGNDSEVAVPRAKDPRYCATLALREWLQAASIDSGPVFRSISKGGSVGRNGLSTQAVANIIKKAVGSAGLDSQLYSGHSLRSGLVTSAVKAGKDLYKIREITRHKTDEMLNIYIRDGEKFENNAAALF